MNPATVSAFFTGVIAVATILYLIFTVALWRATKKAADAATDSAGAAKVSADAAKQSADIAARLNRPYIGVSRLDRRNDDSRTWVIAWAVRNFGSLPAVNVDATIAFKVGPNSWSKGGPASAECFPQADAETLSTILLSEMENLEVVSGNYILEVCIQVKYAGADGSQYFHSAEPQYRHDTKTFAILRSQTQPANG